MAPDKAGPPPPAFRATALDPKQLVSFEELLMSQVTQQEALTRLLIKKGIFTKYEFLEMVRVAKEEKKKTHPVIINIVARHRGAQRVLVKQASPTFSVVHGERSGGQSW